MSQVPTPVPPDLGFDLRLRLQSLQAQFGSVDDTFLDFESNAFNPVAVHNLLRNVAYRAPKLSQSARLPSLRRPVFNDEKTEELAHALKSNTQFPSLRRRLDAFQIRASRADQRSAAICTLSNEVRFDVQKAITNDPVEKSVPYRHCYPPNRLLQDVIDQHRGPGQHFVDRLPSPVHIPVMGEPPLPLRRRRNRSMMPGPAQYQRVIVTADSKQASIPSASFLTTERDRWVPAEPRPPPAQVLHEPGTIAANVLQERLNGPNAAFLGPGRSSSPDRNFVKPIRPHRPRTRSPSPERSAESKEFILPLIWVSLKCSFLLSLSSQVACCRRSPARCRAL